MNSLFDQLLSLNTVPGAFEAWEEYRAVLTSFIQAHTKSGDSCLIVGAGESNDLDLSRLSEHFSAVMLLDRDSEALWRALERYPLGNLYPLTADILGISGDAYRALDTGMVSGLRAGLSGEVLTADFLNAMEDMLLSAKHAPLPQADTVICCGVHSQLLAMFAHMAGIYARYAPIDTRRIFQTIHDYNARLQPAFNARLLASARKTLILGLETGRIGMPGGIEGAAQALADISARGLATAETELLWPFDLAQNKRYTMRITVIDRQASVF